MVTRNNLCGCPVVTAFDPTCKHPSYGSVVTSTASETTEALLDVTGCYGHGVSTSSVTECASGCEVGAGDRTIGGQEGEGGYASSGIVSSDSHRDTKGIEGE